MCVHECGMCMCVVCACVCVHVVVHVCVCMCVRECVHVCGVCMCMVCACVWCVVCACVWCVHECECAWELSSDIWDSFRENENVISRMNRYNFQTVKLRLYIYINFLFSTHHTTSFLYV